MLFENDFNPIDVLTRILLSVILALIFVVISFWQSNKLGKNFIISYIRGFIQIIIMVPEPTSTSTISPAASSAWTRTT